MILRINNNNNVVVMLVSTFLLFSCNPPIETWERELDEFDKQTLYNNDPSGWHLLQEIPTKFTTEYTIEKIENDTLKILYFGTATDEENYIIEYRKRFPCGEMDTCFINIHPELDTLFYYKQSNGIKKFVVGEYSYRFINQMFSAEEQEFFFLHEDSLRRVRGNNLPKLHVAQD